jgi:predicted HTH transcriptional regulator
MQVAGVQKERIEREGNGAVLRPPSARVKKGRDALNVSMKLVLKELKTGPATRDDLMHVVGIKQRAMLKVLADLYRMDLIRISTWEKRGHHAIRVWGLKSTRVDAPKPPRISNAEACRQYRLRKKVGLGSLAA